ncbi:hypothetical protein M8J76_003183 [Diaphorina citri]|nr:hypothetical protein M8J76_003183 [Diaphorina citri]
MDDIQSWWEVPSIAHFCSLFRAAFNLLDFDIEELEEALLTDGTEDTGSSLLQELIVRLLCGCYGRNHGISIFNYQMFLRRLFRTKCREYGRENPFDSDIDFQFLPLRTKVEILQALCDFRLDADDVLDCLKNLESDSLRLQPLGYDRNQSAFWYFYGTRLYREDYPKVRIRPLDPSEEEPEFELDLGAGTWQVVCYTEEDWTKLAEATADAPCKEEKTLHHVLTEDFLPEIPRLFEEKRNLQRKRLMEMAPRSRSNSEDRWTTEDTSSLCSYQTSTGGFAASTGGRKTNNSLSASIGEIIIPPPQPVSKKIKSSHVYRSTEEDLRIGMHKVMNRLKSHEDAWPFCDPVDEATAPNYYEQIKRPMDLTRMEEKLDAGRYKTFGQFRADFQLIVDNCRKYNGLDNEYTDMVRRLQQIFRDAVSRYLDGERSSGSEDEEEMAVEFQEELPPKPKGKRGRKKKIVLSPRSLTPTDEEEDKENEEKSGTPFDSIPSNSDSEREREEVESIKSLSNEPKPPKRRRGRPSKERPNNIPKNSSAAIEALELVTEQTLKDINKWLDDTPRFSEYSNSASNSPSQILGIVEDYESRARIEAEYQRTLSKIDKIDKAARKEALQQKRRLMKEQQAAAALAAAPPPAPPPPKKKREIQRTIERLQPGKSKGNLLSNTSLNKAATEDSAVPTLLPLSKLREKENQLLEEKEELVTTPQLSLGTVLTSDVIGFGIGPKQHSFSDVDEDSSQTSKETEKGKEEAKGDAVEEENEQEKEEEKREEVSVSREEEKGEERVEKVEVKEKVEEDKKPVEDVVSPGSPSVVVKKSEPADKPAAPKDTKPNFNAWFKAFGAPKMPLSTVKRKTDFGNPLTPLSNEFRDSPEMRSEDTMDEISDLPPPTPGRSLGLDEERVAPPPRQRKLSTGSSMSERSSFSQDPTDPLNSPRPSLDEPYVSPQQQPYHHSPSSVAPIKVGFYQDTFPRAGSDKSSSCSPREPPSNQNSPHLQIVSPVQSPKEPYVYSNPMSPYPSPGVYDVPPPTPSYPSISRDLPYFDRPPVYSVAPGPSSPPEKPPATPTPTPTPTSIYPVKKRIYTDMEQQSTPPPPPAPAALPLHPQHQRLMEHYADPRFYPNNPHPHSSIALHSPYTSESPLGYSTKPKPGPELPSPYVQNPTPTSTHNVNTTHSTPPNDNTPLNYSNAPLNFANSHGRGMSGTSSPAAGYMATDYSDPSKSMKPPTSQYEHLMSHMSRFNTPAPTTSSPQMPYPSNQDLLSNKLGYSSHPMYNYTDLMQNKYKQSTGSPAAPSNYPLSFNRPMSPQVFNNPTGDMINYHNKPTEEPPQKKPAAKKPRKKKNQPVQEPLPATSISSGNTTAFQQYMGQNTSSESVGLKPTPCMVPGTGYNFPPNIKDSYSYLEDMRNSGYFLSESASPNVKTPTSSPFSFLPGTTRGTPPNYSSLAQFMNPSTPGSPVLYQQYLQSRSEQLLRPMMLGYPPSPYLNMPPHDRPPWGL